MTRLIIIGEVSERRNGRHRIFNLCQCSCGRRIKVRNDSRAQSCGCLQRELLIERNAIGWHTIHGLSKTCEYETWARMLYRCTTSTSPDFADYGGRGITVCEEWKTFEKFFSDMGRRPDDMTLERKEVNGPYCKSNCRWATQREQSINKRNTVYDNKAY